MVGTELRINFDNMTEYEKASLRDLCIQYNVKPDCRYPGGEIENISFDFKTDIESRDAFVIEVEQIFHITHMGVKRRVFGHRIECPL
ncbi:MAG: hypothetical protein MUO43_08350 [Desulfobacterales bacterium]|nr:hypothetical protein [Desulfobacterales bacterium]